MNIYQKLSAITNDLQTVAKNLNVSAGKSSYKAVSERDIIDAVKPLEVKYKIYSYPVNREIIDDQLLESEQNYNGNTTTKTTFYTRIKTTYRFVNIEQPDEYIDTITFAEGIDSQDKGSGKAMTYSDKYALMKAYKISTGDDPDQDASKDEKYKSVKPEPKPAQKVLHVTEAQAKMISDLGEAGAIDLPKIMAFYKVTAVEELPITAGSQIIEKYGKGE